MKLTTTLTLASTLLVAACATSQRQGDRPAASSAAVPVTHEYVCESGATIIASYPDTDSATVDYQDTTYRMQIAVSASGARYVGGGLEWWTKGSGPGSQGTLYRHSADGTSGKALESCAASESGS